MFTRSKEIIRSIGQRWEKNFCRVWRNLVKTLSPHNDPVLTVTLQREVPSGNIVLGGDLSGTLSAKTGNKLGIALRDMAKARLLVEKGPIPSEKPALVALLPLPRFLLTSDLDELKSLVNDWRGEVLVDGDVPYCYLTILV